MRFPSTLMAPVLLVLLLATSSHAIVTSWTNATGGDWTVTANWSQGVPGLADTADIVLNGTYTVTVTSVADIGTLRLGGTVGTQTVLIDVGGNLTCSIPVAGVPVQIGLHGTLDLVNGFLDASTTGGSTAIVNEGLLVVRPATAIYAHDDNLVNESTGSLDFDGELNVDTLHNHGLFMSPDSTTEAILFGIMRNHGDGAIAVPGWLRIDGVTNSGLIDMFAGGLLSVSDDYDLYNLSAGLVRLAGGAQLEPLGADLNNAGEVRMDADTSLDDDHAHIYMDYTGTSTGLVNVLSGSIEFRSAADFNGDSAYVASACTLQFAGLTDLTDPSSRLTGTGRVHFGAGDYVTGASVGCNWSSTLGVYGTATPSATYNVTFNPVGGPADQISSLHIGSDDFTFTIPAASVLEVDTLRQDGGTILGEVASIDLYDWAEGTLSTNTNASVTVPSGAVLFVNSDSAKTLDSLELVVEGAAIFTGAGPLSLLDSSRVNIRPLATLEVGSFFQMDGVGDLYNSGHATFDPQGDTINIGVLVWNSPTGRTPGTIDVLSSPTVFSNKCVNEGTINILDGGGLSLTDEFKNEGGTIVIVDGGVIEISDTLINGSSGTVELAGGSEISGDGELTNGGSMNVTGGVVLTPTNVPVQPRLSVSPDSGYLNVLADTLTLLGGGENFGVITIAPGAVLKIIGLFINQPGGIIQGGGTLDISAATFTNQGTISAGLSPGALAIVGNLNLGPLSVLNMEMAGAFPIQYDRLNILGTLARGGTLNLILLGGYYPATTDTLTLFTYSAITGEFADINGLDLAGQFFELDFGPGGCRNYVCSGVSDISYGPAAIADTINQTISLHDTLLIPVCNTGWCPLTYTASIQNLSPPSPLWASFADPDTGGLVLRTDCDTLRVALNALGLAIGTHSFDVVIDNNDPDDLSVTVAVSVVVQHGPEVWDIGGPSPDFASMTAAVSYLNGAAIPYPQIFNVYPGTYVGNLVLNANGGSSPTNTIRFQAADPLDHPVVLHGSANSILRLNGIDYLIWDGIDIARTGSASNTRAIVDTAGADNNTIRNCAITGFPGVSGTTGIFMRSASNPGTTCDGNVFENLTISNFATGVSLGVVGGVVPGQSDNVIRNCTVQDCGIGIIIGGQRRAQIHDNVVQPFYSGGTAFGMQVGQLLGTDTVSVFRNQFRRFIGATPVGIQVLTGNGYVMIYNNLFTDWSASTGTYTAIDVGTNTKSWIAHNTIFLSENPSAAVTRAVGIKASGTSFIATILNNLVYSDASSDTSVGVEAVSSATVTCDYNCCYSPHARFRYGRYNSTFYSALADWQAATPFDDHSLQDNPGLFDSASVMLDGYWTTCDENGTPLAWVGTDYFGTPRDPTTPDIGAFEFTGLYAPVNNLIVDRNTYPSPNMFLGWSTVPGAASYVVYADTSYTDLAISTADVLDTTHSTSYLHLGALFNPAFRYYYLVRPSTIP